MYILVTDVLSCPRCGPDFGLILVSERTVSRRVLEGIVACANCRERYPIRGGFADLRVRGATQATEDEARAARDAPGSSPEQRAFRLLALLGITAGPALALVIGEAAVLAGAMTHHVEALELIVADARLADATEQPGITRVAVGGRLPFYDRSLQGVVLSGPAAAQHLEEAARVLAPLGRLVLEGAPPDAAERAGKAGLRLLAEEGGMLVAARA
jgi:uncharacterized protein YbaR (Trm112 family)